MLAFVYFCCCFCCYDHTVATAAVFIVSVERFEGGCRFVPNILYLVVCDFRHIGERFVGSLRMLTSPSYVAALFCFHVFAEKLQLSQRRALTLATDRFDLRVLVF